MEENYHVSNIELEVLPAVIQAKFVKKETVPTIYWMYCTLSVFQNKAFSYLVFHHVISGVKEEICVHSIWRAGQTCQLSPWDPSPWGAVWKASKPFVANFPSWGAQRKRWECHRFCTQSWQERVYTRKAKQAWFVLGWPFWAFYIKGPSCAWVLAVRTWTSGVVPAANRACSSAWWAQDVFGSTYC